MDFFGLDERTGKFVATPMVWVYILATIALSGFTLLLYYGLHHKVNHARWLFPIMNIQMVIKRGINYTKGSTESDASCMC